MRLIDADWLSRNLDGMMAVSPTGYIHGDTIADMIGDAPTIEPERKTGKWIRWYETKEDETGTEYIPHCRCSECGTEYDPHSSKFVLFCNVCGAKMEGGEQE